MDAKIAWYYRILWHERKKQLNKNICSIDIARVLYQESKPRD